MRTVRLVRLSLAGVLLGLVGCGGQSTTHAGTETGGSSGQGGQASSDAGRGNAGSAGAAGRQNRLCPTEQATDLLSVSADCRIVERGSDTAATCGGAPYALQERVDRGEMLISYCLRSETGGSGTADLVLARLTDAEPVLSHFRFDTESAVPAGDYPVAMAARGETLLVAAMLSGDAQHVLTYLEIDSSQLP
jgi:hypothetical protein